MAKFLYWKAKVVHSLAIAVVFLFIFQSAISQSAIPESSSLKISLNCEARHFQDILNEIEAMTGLHFVYSSNMVQVNKPVSLKVIEKPLNEVLDLLGRQMHLVFKRKGQHVVIKKIDKPFPVSQQLPQPKKVPPANVPGNPEQKLSGVSENIVYQTSIQPDIQHADGYPGLVLSKGYFKKPHVDLNQYFDAAKLPDLPKHYLQSVNIKNNHPGWFVSTGFLINDYSAGAEFQAGLRSVYLVFSPTWLKDGRYHGAYGLGTSLLLKRNLSFNTVYTFGLLKKEKNYSASTLENISKDDLASSSKHHQLRFMMQYSLSRNINLRAGLTINHMKTTHHFPAGDFLRNRRSLSFGQTSVVNGYSSFPYRQVVITRGLEAPPPAFETLRMWMGWETSLSYRFNFYRH